MDELGEAGEAGARGGVRAGEVQGAGEKDCEEEMRVVTDAVPNQFPLVEPSGVARYAIVGECPGRDEANIGTPFVGSSGMFLDDALGSAGIARSQCFVGNVCQHRPPGESNDFGRLKWEQVLEGVRRLREDLERFRPTIVLCLGNAALHLFKEGDGMPRRGKDGYNWPNKVGSWRGSLFESEFLSPSCVRTQPAREGMVDTCSVRSTDPASYERCGSTPHGLKCLSTFHPAVVLREYGLQAYVDFDVRRFRAEGRARELVLPKREIGVVGRDMMLETGLRILARMTTEGKLVSVDIEGYPGNVTCIGFSRTPENAVVFPLTGVGGESRWSEDEEVQIWSAVKTLIECPTVPKLAQNGTYDFFALAWTYGIVVHNWLYDTRQGWWECYPELRASLAVQASILTKQPFYKPDKDDETQLKFASDDEFWEYNGIDATVTLECHLRQMEMLGEERREHYAWKMTLMPSVLYMMLRGMKWDKGRALEESKKAELRALELQGLIDAEGARARPMLGELLKALERRDETGLAKIVTSTLCGKAPKVKVEVEDRRWQRMRWTDKKWVRDGKLCKESPEEGEIVDAGSVFDTRNIKFEPKHRMVSKLVTFVPVKLLDCKPHVLDSKRREWVLVRRAWKQQDTRALASALGLSFNTGSTNVGGDAQRFLYDVCGLRRVLVHEHTGRLSWESEKDWKKRGAGESVALPQSKKICTDQNAINKLYVKTQDVRVLWLLQQRRLKKVVTDMATEVDRDERLRASISLVKETGRMSESICPTGTGLNRQALNKDLRRVCVADEGCVFVQRDLSGADSWTVACECAALGDRTMLEDLRAGLKPAKVLALLEHEGERVNELDRDEIKRLLKEKEPEFPGWLYAGAKSCVHGSSYGMGIATMIETLLRFSMGDLPLELGASKPLVLEEAQVEKLQQLFFTRYPGIHKWHHREGWNMVNRGWFETSTGHRRTIFGRKAEIKKMLRVPCHETLKEVLSSKPQYYTTLAAQLVLWRMWYDEENRSGDGRLKVEPLLLVHDSVLVQARADEQAFAVAKMEQWFKNEIEIAGEKVRIPADQKIGDEWS